ncbi:POLYNUCLEOTIDE ADENYLYLTRANSFERASE FAMILY PROTEIN [Salix viminalis]|uniref:POLYNUCLEOTIDE ADENYLYLTRANSFERASE FAMILY PROTEIN n=1 Tax=Salix viminalis TaxID=40686 RepID=A0A9Q0QAT8_SALVM|nr:POLYNUCLEOTIDE ADENYLYLTRANSFERASE FAMILY PROTEIN [Salix viminalis]
MTIVVTLRTYLCSQSPLIRHCNNSVVAAASTIEQARLHKEEGHLLVINSTSKKEKVSGERKAPEWKKLDANELGISHSMISKPTRVVLNGLKRKGYEVYLVGGCVRDLILKRIPKDFDVRKAFHRCEIVGKRFPICHVHVDDVIVEVSSFSTSQLKSDGKFNGDVRKPLGCSKCDFIRWRNCLQRDFTINGLMFDPYANIVYDYMGGMADIKKTKVRTIIPANLSFVEDSGEARILLELNYMLAYGSAEASLRLMWRFGLLEILLPIQASYFVSQGFRRRDERSNMLLSLFSNLDRLVAPDRPCHTILWVDIFAFHMALVDQPQDPLVVAAFILAVHSGGALLESVKIARRISQPYQIQFPRIIGSTESRFK